MTAQLEIPTMESRAEPSEAGMLLLRVLAVLEREGIPYCLLHGYEQYPHQIRSDVDCLLPASALPDRLAQVLHTHRAEIGADLVQWVDGGAQFIVLARQNPDDPPTLLQLHVSTQYELAGKVFFKGEQILSRRRRHGSFWVPAVGTEFCCVLLNKFVKGRLTEEHGRRLSALYFVDPGGCDQELARFFSKADMRLVAAAAGSGDWEAIRDALPRLRERALSRGTGLAITRRVARQVKRLGRWIRPRCGLHVVFLGPDGVGKSTVIEHVQRDMLPAFLHSTYLTFAPGLIPGRFAAPKPGGPHSLPPRSLPASLAKAAWWLVCYTVGYLATVHPTRARAGLVINHRYLMDAMVDRKRYRYSGPAWILRAIWWIAPKPDLVILLDAPPEVIQRRKQEVAFEETVRQRNGYRSIVTKLPNGHVVDASRPLADVVGDVEQLISRVMSARVAARFDLETR